MYMDPEYYQSNEFNYLTTAIGIITAALLITISYVVAKIRHKIIVGQTKKRYDNERIIYIATPALSISLFEIFFCAWYIGALILPFYIFSNLEYINLGMGHMRSITNKTAVYHLFAMVFCYITLTFFGQYTAIITNKRILSSLLSYKIKYFEFLPENIKEIFIEEEFLCPKKLILVDSKNKKYCLGPYSELKEFYEIVSKYLKRRKIKNE